MLEIVTRADLEPLLAGLGVLQARVTALEGGIVPPPPPPPPPPPDGRVIRVTDRIAEVIPHLQPGDVIEVVGRAEPYREKLNFWQSDFTLRGVSGPNSEAVILDAEGAVENAAFGIPDVESVGLISLYHRREESVVPKNITFQNIHVRGAYNGRKFKKADGTEGTYVLHASGFWLGHFGNVRIDGCIIYDCGNGIFASGNQENIGLKIYNNATFANGLAGVPQSDRCHTFYCEVGGVSYENNNMGPMRPGTGGGQIKDRGDVIAVYGNRIEGGSRQIDLSYPESSLRWMKQRRTYCRTLVENNTLILLEGDGVQWLYAEGRTDDFGNGQVIDLIHNTLICYRDGTSDRDAAKVCGTADQYTPALVINAENNIVFVSKKTTGGWDCWASWIGKGGRINAKARNVVPGWMLPSHKNEPPLAILDVEGTVHRLGVQDQGMPDPGFVDLAGGDYRMKPESPYADLGAQ